MTPARRSRDAGAPPGPGPEPFEVTCPGCGVRLTVDPRTRAVIRAVGPHPSTEPGSLDAALAGLRGAQARREARFQEAADAERNRKDVLARKFRVGLDRARETPDPPRRPFDGD